MVAGPFVEHRANPEAVDDLGGRLSRFGSQAESVGAHADRLGRLAGTVESHGLFDPLRSVVQPSRTGGDELASAGRVGKLALSVWARGVRAYNQTIRDLNQQWETAKATDFGVDELSLDRSAMKPDDIDAAVAEHTAAIGRARQALWAEFVRHRNDAEDRLDRVADGVALVLTHADDPDVRTLADLGLNPDGTFDWSGLTGAFDIFETPEDGSLNLDSDYPDSVMEGDPDAYWSTPEARAAQMREWELDNYDPSEARADVVGALTFIFGDPRQCVGGDASVGGCGLEVAGFLGIGKVLKLGRAARHIDEAEDAARAAERAPASSAAQAKRLKAELSASEISHGHAYADHIEEFEGLGITSRANFERHIENVINNGDEARDLRNGRTAYWDSQSGTIVIRNPNASDGGTAFVPDDGYTYFRDRIS